MRGIFSSFLPFMLALLLVQAVGAQNISIELTPITYPIVLPDSGGSFDYLLTVTNQGAPITATVWCMATLPNGSSSGPVVGPATQTLGAGQALSIHRTQNIPPRAPFGYFVLHAYAGIYPDTVWAQDQFEFQRQGFSGTEQEWVARYDGPVNSGDHAYSITVDDDGNVYVTGSSYGVGTSADYFTVKYDAWGNQVWAARYNGPGNGYETAISIAVDGDGNIYVTGASPAFVFNNDYATVKYDAWGNQVWVARYNGPGNSADWASSLVVDSGGNVYVTGGSIGNGGNFDYATVKYDASGNQIWAARYTLFGPVNYDDFARSLAVDAGGNVYVTGESWGGTTAYDYATVKYDARGNQVWEARYNGPGNSYDGALDIALDRAGNVYVTGGSTGTGTLSDYATLKYDPGGNQVWEVRYNGPGNSYDGASDIALDRAGNVYVTGNSTGTGTLRDYTTLKYDAAGNQVWEARYDGQENDDDIPSCLALDSLGNISVTGVSRRFGTHNDYATVKYDAWGNQVWVARYNGLGNFQDDANSVAMDGSGNVYVTGRSYGSGSDFDYATIKYSGGDITNWMPVEATVLGQPLPLQCRLEGNYPNPFNASTALSYQLTANSYVRLRVYDTAGRLVETLVDGWRAAGEHRLTWEAGDLPSGMYFAKLQTGEYVGAQKMILLK